MLNAEQIVCRIPTPDANKTDVLYCTTNATNAVDIWVAIGTVGSAVVAAGLAVWTVIDAAKRRKREDQARIDKAEGEYWANRESVMLLEGDNVSDAVDCFDVEKPRELLENAKSFVESVRRYRLRTGDYGEAERELGKALTELAQTLGMKTMNLTHHYEVDEAFPEPSEFERFQFSFQLMEIKSFVRSACIEMAQAKSRNEVARRAEQAISTAEKLTDNLERSL